MCQSVFWGWGGDSVGEVLTVLACEGPILDPQHPCKNLCVTTGVCDPSLGGDWRIDEAG